MSHLKKLIVCLSLLIGFGTAFPNPIYKVEFKNPSGFLIPYDPASIIMTNSYWCNSDGQAAPVITQFSPNSNYNIYVCPTNPNLGLFHATIDYVMIDIAPQNPKVGCRFYSHCDKVDSVGGKQVCLRISSEVTPYAGLNWDPKCSTAFVSPSPDNNYVGTITFNIDPTLK